MPLLVPPNGVPQKIVKYLDYKCAQINKFIQKKKRLIELLKEQKQVIINQAVTRGLDPNVRLKPSDVEWLGDIPQHWEILPLRWYMQVNSGDFHPTETIRIQYSEITPFPIIGGNGITGYSAKSNSSKTCIVIGRVGALCGNVHLIETPAWITDNALRLKNIKKFNLNFLTYILQTRNLNALSKANAQPLLTGSMIKAQRVCCPPLEKQKMIVENQ